MRVAEVKRYSVEINGLIMAAFDSVEEAQQYVEAESGVWTSIATIYDHEAREVILTEIRL